MLEAAAPAMANPTSSGPDGVPVAKFNNATTAKTVPLEVRAPPLKKITQGFTPLLLLAQRLAQNSWNELQDLINALQRPGMSDGEKKSRIAKYAQSTRKQYIKLLVIAVWAENAGAVSDVIDLGDLLRQRHMTYFNAINMVFDIRKQMNGAKVPNPDLVTAMEVLSTGHPKVDIMKHYVPPPKLTSVEILKTLRHLNASVSIRLGLHETLPPHFRDYKVASGRATFSVPYEFEVDVSIADENVESQLYMIDVRPLYEPTAKPLPTSVLRDLEGFANGVLKDRGLEGLYDYLHEYFMTAKIMALLTQAHELTRRRWSENLNIQLIKRTLVIQYWPHKYGPKEREKEPKSWIELGARRGVNGKPSKLGVRWVRDGKEIKDVNVPLNVSVLSAESLVKTVIALHTKHILTSVRDTMVARLGPANAGTLRLHIDETDSFDSYLEIKLTPNRSCRFLIEPITGRFSVRKQNVVNVSAENRLNLKPNDAADVLIRLKLLTMQEEVEQRGRSMGWEVFKNIPIRREEMKQFFPHDTRYAMFMRRKGWSPSWLMAYVVEETSSSFFIVEINETRANYFITASHKIRTEGVLRISFRFLHDLEKMCAATISHFVNSRALCSLGVPHVFRPSPAPHTALRVPDLYIRFSRLTHTNWALDVLKVLFLNLTPSGATTLLVCGRTKHPISHLTTPPPTKESDVSFHPATGNFVIRLTTAVGTPVIPFITQKLQRIQRLISFVSVIRRFALQCVNVSLGRITFQYPGNNTAEIRFDHRNEEKGMTLHLPPASPHSRMHALLQVTLNSTGLEPVLKALLCTTPLLTALDSLPPTHELFLLIRALDWVRLEYRPRNFCVDLRLKQRRGTLMWFASDAGERMQKSERVKCDALTQVWESDGGAGWVGLKTGAAAEGGGVAGMIQAVFNALVS